MGNGKARKIFNIIAVVLVLAALSVGIWWLSSNWSSISSGSTLYTESELEEYGDKRYESGLERAEEYKELSEIYKNRVIQLEESENQLIILLEEEKSKTEQNEELISTLESTIATLRAEINSLNEQITLYEEQKEKDEQTIQDLQNQNKADKETIANLESYTQLLLQDKESLQASNTAKDEQILELESQIEDNNSEIAELNTTISDREAQIAELNNQVADLEAQVLNLNNEVIRLTAELEAYKDMELTGVYRVEFMDGESVEAVVYVDEGETLPYIPEIKNTQESWFYGWTLTEGSSEVVDLNGYIPTTDVTFYSVESECVSVAVKNMAGSETAMTTPYRFGNRLTVRDALEFNNIDINQENITVNFYKGIVINKDITFDTLITDLPTGKVSGGYTVDGVVKYVYGHILSFDIRYNYSITKTGSEVTLSEDFEEVYVMREEGLFDFNAKITIKNSDGVEETVALTKLPSTKTRSTNGTLIYTFDTTFACGATIELHVVDTKTTRFATCFRVLLENEDVLNTAVYSYSARLCPLYADVNAKAVLTDIYQYLE